MPWTTADVDQHMKGLTPQQKAQWVKMANSMLQRCQEQGGKNCDVKAIRMANAAMNDMLSGGGGAGGQ